MKSNVGNSAYISNCPYQYIWFVTYFIWLTMYNFLYINAKLFTNYINNSHDNNDIYGDIKNLS